MPFDFWILANTKLPRTQQEISVISEKQLLIFKIIRKINNKVQFPESCYCGCPIIRSEIQMIQTDCPENLHPALILVGYKPALLKSKMQTQHSMWRTPY